MNFVGRAIARCGYSVVEQSDESGAHVTIYESDRELIRAYGGNLEKAYETLLYALLDDFKLKIKENGTNK
jgi:hypothetical protein